MIFDQIPAGSAVFLDANVLVYACVSHPVHGGACERLLDRIENQEFQGVTSAHVLADVAHRLMTIEACDRFGWPTQGIANRLRRHPPEIQQLVVPRRALDEISAASVSILPVTVQHVSRAVDLSSQFGLLTGDGLIAALMQAHGLKMLASLDDDFDRIPWIIRARPV